MKQYVPGMRVIIRDEEWIIKKLVKNDFGEDMKHIQLVTNAVM